MLFLGLGCYSFLMRLFAFGKKRKNSMEAIFFLGALALTLTPPNRCLLFTLGALIESLTKLYKGEEGGAWCLAFCLFYALES